MQVIVILVIDKNNLPCPVGNAMTIAEAERKVKELRDNGLNATYYMSTK